jgi:hypothetical protein
MKKSVSAFVFTATALVTFVASASAETIRDHRGSVSGGVVVRDHRTICVIGDPNCRDHREPLVVVPPRALPEPPVTVIVDPVRPHPPLVNGGISQDDLEPRITCRQGRRLLREEGFRHVRAYDCVGSVYGYRATNGNKGANIKLSAYGEIIDVSYYYLD